MYVREIGRAGGMDFILRRHYIIVRDFATFHGNPAGEITKSYWMTNAGRRQFIAMSSILFLFLLLQAFVVTIVVN